MRSKYQQWISSGGYKGFAYHPHLNAYTAFLFSYIILWIDNRIILLPRMVIECYHSTAQLFQKYFVQISLSIHTRHNRPNALQNLNRVVQPKKPRLAATEKDLLISHKGPFDPLFPLHVNLTPLCPFIVQIAPRTSNSPPEIILRGFLVTLLMQKLKLK